ncbi:MAG: response regulator [Bryobacteraceae bacterium]
MRPLILCVDDDPLVLDVTRAALERGGCRVLPAASGAEAIRALEKSPEDVALAILDLTVADMRCAHVIARLKTLRPGLKILLTSGYGRAAVPLQVSRKVEGFLAKPYLPRQLVQRVEWLLRSVRPARTASGSGF